MLVLAALAAPEGEGQQPSQSFRAGVEIVEVPVTVLDAKRQPVRGLRVEDFTILEDGKPRPVVAFAAVNAATPAAANSAQTTVATAAPANTAPVSDIDAQQGDGRAVVIVLDRSIPFGTPTQMSRLVAQTVVQSMTPNDIGAVIFTSPSQRSQDLTADRAKLVAAIGSNEPNSSDSPDQRVQSEMLRDTIEAQLWIGLRDNPVPRIIPDLDLSGECMCGLCVLETITHIAKTLEQLPRRTKSLVFIGFELNLETSQVQCSSKVRDTRRVLFQALDQSSLIVHTIDAAGLETRLISASLTVQGRDLVQPISPRPGSLSVVDREAQRHLARQGNLAVLPDRTGGRFVVHTNDPQLLVGGILGESASYGTC